MSLLRRSGLVLFASATALACWQNNSPFGIIHASGISGVITFDGHPIKAAIVELHAATGDSVKNWDTRYLQTTSTDAEGGFDLGTQKPGKYLIVMRKPLYEQIPVALMAPTAVRNSEELDVQFTADFCLHLGVRTDKAR